MKKSTFPDSLVLIFAMIIAAQLLSYVMPAGEFEREERRVVAGSYHAVEAVPLLSQGSLSPRGTTDSRSACQPAGTSRE